MNSKTLDTSFSISQCYNTFAFRIEKKTKQINNTEFFPPIKFFPMTSILNKCMVLRYEEKKKKKKKKNTILTHIECFKREVLNILFIVTVFIRDLFRFIFIFYIRSIYSFNRSYIQLKINFLTPCVSFED